MTFCALAHSDLGVIHRNGRIPGGIGMAAFASVRRRRVTYTLVTRMASRGSTGTQYLSVVDLLCRPKRAGVVARAAAVTRGDVRSDFSTRIATVMT